MINKNSLEFTFLSISENESLARSIVGIFALQLNPTLSQLSDIKTAVSEAVTNCIVHGYPKMEGEITIQCMIENNILHINVFDEGVGIENVEKAIEPFFTTKSEEERSGMGFTIMQTFMDDVKVESSIHCGTKVYMVKNIKKDG